MKRSATESNADQSAWPLLRSERTWGPVRLGIALAAAAAATWCYLIGEYAGYYLNFFQGTMALTAGSMIGMLAVLLAAGPACIRFGIDSVASVKPQFGTQGWALPAAMQFVSIIGWNSLLLIFFARSLTQLLVITGVLPDGARSHVIVPMTVLSACILIYLVLLRGAKGVTRLSSILVLHVFVGLWMLGLLVTRQWPVLLAARPALARPDKLWNYTAGVEIGICSLLSWWAYIGAMIRMAPNGRTAAVPVMLGMGAPVPLLSLIGLAGILVLKSSDPSEWLRNVGGPIYAVIALLFVAAANLGTAVAGIYASALGLRNFRMVQRLPWPVVILLTLAPVAVVGLLIPDLFFASFGNFLAFIGVAFAPLCGIQITDYYLLRRRRLDIRGMFDNGPHTPYYFWAGWNPVAVISMVVGCAVYVVFLNPITYVSHGPFRVLTASLPSAAAAGLLYWMLTVAVVIPAGRGGYRL